MGKGSRTRLIFYAIFQQNKMNTYSNLQNWQIAFDALDNVGETEEQRLEVTKYQQEEINLIISQTQKMMQVALGGIEKLNDMKDQERELHWYLSMAVILRFFYAKSKEKQELTLPQIVYGKP